MSATIFTSLELVAETVLISCLVAFSIMKLVCLAASCLFPFNVQSCGRSLLRDQYNDASSILDLVSSAVKRSRLYFIPSQLSLPFYFICYDFTSAIIRSIFAVCIAFPYQLLHVWLDALGSRNKSDFCQAPWVSPRKSYPIRLHVVIV